LDAGCHQKFKGRRILVGKGTHHVSVAVPAFAVVEADPILKDLVRRILYSVPPLSTRPTAEVDTSPAQHSVSTDVEVLLDHDHGCAVLECRNGSRESRDPSPDGDEICRQVPTPLWTTLCLHVREAQAGQRTRAEARSCTCLEEISSTDIGVLLLRVHAHILTFQDFSLSQNPSRSPSGTIRSKLVMGDSRLGDLFYTISTTTPQGSPAA
jgi:hypothetical protein